MTEGLLRSFGGFEGSLPEGAPNFLEVALVWEFPHGILPKQNSEKFASEAPKLLRSPLRSCPTQSLTLKRLKSPPRGHDRMHRR